MKTKTAFITVGVIAFIVLMLILHNYYKLSLRPPITKAPPNESWWAVVENNTNVIDDGLVYTTDPKMIAILERKGFIQGKQGWYDTTIYKEVMSVKHDTMYKYIKLDSSEIANLGMVNAEQYHSVHPHPIGVSRAMKYTIPEKKKPD